ncbi:unnamed protein product [Rotaria sp. Silwood2]|nr:unnamed protein product [Rotaria sp. Silwood2]
MDTHDDNKKVRDKFQQQLILKKLEFQFELEKLKITEEAKRQTEQTKYEIEKHKIIEETKYEIEKQKLIQQVQLQEINAQLAIERYKLELEFGSSSIKTSDILLWFHDDFYKYYVSGHLYSFNANDLFKNHNDLNDNILTHIQCYLDECSSNSQLNKIFIQQAFDKMMVKLLKEINPNTILKYLNTSYQDYLQKQFHPACTFIYKNVNLNIKEQYHLLSDFVVFLGDLKTPNVSLTDTSAIGQVLQYLKVLLDVQKRRKIYGFLCNYKEIKFFYVENKDNKDCYKYYESEQLKMFSNLSETSFIDDMSRKTIKHSRNLCINKDTWKVFITFLTMNFDFYEYTHLNIDPYDNLLCNEYMITKRLGKYLAFEKELQRIESLSLKQSKQVIDVLHYLYKSCIIHRDICPENIMLDNYNFRKGNKHIKLVDFGSAISYDMNDMFTTIPMAGTVAYPGQTIRSVNGRLRSPYDA